MLATANQLIKIKQFHRLRTKNNDNPSLFIEVPVPNTDRAKGTPIQLEVNSGAPEGLIIPASIVAPVV
jgi:hypothetical protein